VQNANTSKLVTKSNNKIFATVAKFRDDFVNWFGFLSTSMIRTTLSHICHQAWLECLNASLINPRDGSGRTGLLIRWTPSMWSIWGAIFVNPDGAGAKADGHRGCKEGGRYYLPSVII